MRYFERNRTPARRSTAATTPRPPARHALEDLFDQDSVVGSGGFGSSNDEGDSNYFGD
jgi:hypothetical protein